MSEVNGKILLKHYGCVRGSGALKATRDLLPRHHIKKGPLKGCEVLPNGMTVKFGRGYALLFKPVIRVDL